MKTLEMESIGELDILILKIAVFFWQEYHPNSVLMAYDELVKREYLISNSILNKMTEFRENELLRIA